MNFKESVKCEPKKTEKEKTVEAYIEFINSQGENFIKFVEILNDCIGIAEKYELVGDVCIKARIKDFDSSNRNTEEKAVDDIFGIEIIPKTERDKEWIMLLTELFFKIGKNKGLRIEENGYVAYNQMVSLRDDKEEYDFSNITEIIKNTKIKEKRSHDSDKKVMAYKYPTLKKKLEDGINLEFDNLEKRALTEIVQRLDRLRKEIKLYNTCDYMPMIEMQMKTSAIAEDAIRGTSRHDYYKVLKTKENLLKRKFTEAEKKEIIKEHEDRMKRLYGSGYIKRSINAPIKFERINGKIKLQSFEKTLLDMWPFLRESIVQDRIDFGIKKNREYNKHTSELLAIFPFLSAYVPNKSDKYTDETRTKLILLMENTDISNADCINKKTIRRRVI